MSGHGNDAKSNCGLNSVKNWYQFSFQNFLKVAES